MHSESENALEERTASVTEGSKRSRSCVNKERRDEESLNRSESGGLVLWVAV